MFHKHERLSHLRHAFRHFSDRDLMLFLIERIVFMDANVQNEFNALTDRVKAVSEVDKSALAALQGIEKQLQDALASSNSSDEIVTAVHNVVASMGTSSADLAAAIAALPGQGGSSQPSTPVTPPVDGGDAGGQPVQDGSGANNSGAATQA